MVRTGRSGLHSSESLGVAGIDGTSDGLVVAMALVGNLLGVLAVTPGEEDLAAPQHEGIGGA